MVLEGERLQVGQDFEELFMLGHPVRSVAFSYKLACSARYLAGHTSLCLDIRWSARYSLSFVCRSRFVSCCNRAIHAAIERTYLAFCFCCTAYLSSCESVSATLVSPEGTTLPSPVEYDSNSSCDEFRSIVSPASVGRKTLDFLCCTVGSCQSCPRLVPWVLPP